MVISIVFALIINVKIGYDYLHTYGKEKALFGLHDFFVSIFCSCIRGILSLFVLTIAIVFLSVWRIVLLTN